MAKVAAPTMYVHVALVVTLMSLILPVYGSNRHEVCFISFSKYQKQILEPNLHLHLDLFVLLIMHQR